MIYKIVIVLIIENKKVKRKSASIVFYFISLDIGAGGIKRIL